MTVCSGGNLLIFNHHYRLFFESAEYVARATFLVVCRDCRPYPGGGVSVLIGICSLIVNYQK